MAVRSENLNLYIAPIQGHTDAAWRYFHNKIYGGNHKYFTPFMHCEHGEIRLKDLRDFSSQLNEEICLEPQVIFKNEEELDVSIRGLVDAGTKAVNLNLGCPFPPQMAKGRGAAFIANKQEMRKLPEVLAKYQCNGVKFSVKMRLGAEGPDEWKGIIDVLNELELDNVYVHPRTARQKYSGELYWDCFAEFMNESKNPVVFNGDIKTPEDIVRISDTFGAINGVMIGRGILGRPSLTSEYEGGEWTREDRIEKMLEFHEELFNYCRQHLCGDTQILSKIKPFWEYAEAEIGRKAWKAIRKSTSLAKYKSAVSLIE